MKIWIILSIAISLFLDLIEAKTKKTQTNDYPHMNAKSKVINPMMNRTKDDVILLKTSSVTKDTAPFPVKKSKTKPSQHIAKTNPWSDKHSEKKWKIKQTVKSSKVPKKNKKHSVAQPFTSLKHDTASGGSKNKSTMNSVHIRIKHRSKDLKLL
jgi:hypothetical protein